MQHFLASARVFCLPFTAPVLALTAAVLLVFGAQAKPRPVITIVHPWIAAPPGGAQTAAGYLTLKNIGKVGDVFMGGQTPAAQKLELHSMFTTGGVMRMRPADAGVPLGPGRTVTFAPGDGYHLMLVRPTHALKVGEDVAVTLNFAKAGAVRAIFVVEAPGRVMTMP